MKNSNQEALKKKLKHYVMITVAAFFVLLCCMGSIIGIAYQAERQSHVAYVNALIGEYRLRFRERVASDLSIVGTMASMLEQGYLSTEDLIRDIVTSFPEYGQYVKIGYYHISADDTYITLPGSDVKYEYSHRPPEEQAVIQQAWTGQGGVSQVYHEDGESYVCYAIPLYKDGEIEGAITATLQIDRFKEIMDTVSSQGIWLNLTWVDQNGTPLAFSQQDARDGKREDLIAELYPILSEFTSVGDGIWRYNTKYNGQDCSVYWTDIGINDWSLVYIDAVGMVQSPIYTTIIALFVASSVLVMACLLLFFFVIRYLRKDRETVVTLSSYDSLTSVYNLNGFLEYCQRQEESGEPYCLVILNFRHFHYVNTLLGRATADQLLCDATVQMRDSLQINECICRYKNDEFCLLLRTADTQVISQRLEEMMNAVSDLPAKVHINYALRLYCGVAICEDGKFSTAQIGIMLNQAEQALKTVKSGYDNEIAFYNHAIHQEESLQRQLENSMEEAIAQKQFKVYLQPKKNFATGEICSAEALVRWVRPDGTMIFPDQFIPLFESNGFCVKMDLYMVEQVCLLQRRWMDLGYKPFPISVNQSKLLFCQQDYVETLCDITAKYNVPNSSLILEILEGLMITDIPAFNQTIQKLRAAGFQVSMDDFGSGYTSLNTFTSMDLDELKLDRTFLQAIGTVQKTKQKTMMENLIATAKSFGIRTVAEGVETLEQEEFLKSIGCDLGQGYLYSKPIPVAEFEKKYLRNS